MKKIIAFTFIALFFPLLCLATPIPNGYPPALIYKDGPMSPLLFCPFASDTSPKPTDVNQDLINNGYIGSSYALKAGGEAFQGESYYKVVGQANGYFIVSSICNLNGENTLTSLYQVKPDAGNLSIKSIYGGDLKDGGILDVTQQDNQMLYTVALTQDHFFSLIHVDLSQSKNKKKSNCEDCTFAKETFSRSLGEQLGEQTLVSIEMVAPEKLAEHTCLTEVASMSKRHDKIVLTPSDLSVFPQRIKLCQSMQARFGTSVTHWLLGIMPPSFWSSNGIIDGRAN